MSDCTILGMPVDVPDGDDLRTAQPLAGIVIAKAIDPDGDLRYLVGCTADLMSVEVLGMLRYATLRMEHGLFGSQEDA
jgi:hypothetical protein